MKRLTVSDGRAIEELVSREPELNLFILGGVQEMGSGRIAFYGEYEGEHLIAVIMQYRDESISTYFIKNPSDKYIEKLRELIYENKIEGINCGEDIGDKIKPYLKKEIKAVDMCTLAGYVNNNNIYSSENIQKLDESHAREISVLQKHIFNQKQATEEDVENREKDLLSGKIKSYGVIQNNRVVSVADVVSEGKCAAMIVGVATEACFRGKGFATSCVYKICSDLEKVGKKAVLFYTNPIAARVYEKIGFQAIDTYYMMQTIYK